MYFLRVVYGILAGLTVLVHAAFVAFVLVGGFMAWHWRWVAWLHLPATVWGVALEFGGWICPLTPLENHFRARAGQAGYSGGFLDHYLTPLLYPAGLAPPRQAVLGALALGVNVVAYTVLVRRLMRGA